jgi:predicted Zn-dependent peptidase
MKCALEGHKEIVKSAGIAKLKGFHQRGYGAKNMDLTLVGCLPDNIKELIEQSFGHRKPGVSTRIDYPVLAPLEEKRVMHVSYPGSNHQDGRLISNVTFSLITVPDMHPDNFANRILFKILGELPTSRLNTRLSLEEGLTYGVSSDYNTDCNAGQNSLEFTCPVQSWNRSIDIMFEEMNRLREQGVNEKELKKCKRDIMFQLAKIAESNVDQANVIVDFLDSGRTLEDISNGYAAVTIADIQRVAQTYLPEDRENGKYVLMIEDPTIE